MIPLAEAKQKFEARIKGLPREQQQAERARFATLMAQERNRRLTAVVGEESAAQGGSVARSVMGSLGAFGLNAVNTATLGTLPRIAGAVAGPGSRERMELGIEASQQTNPAAASVGGLAGFFAPGSVAGKLASGASKAATAVTGTNALMRATQASPFAARASAQILRNFVGGSAAIGATTLAEDNGRDLSTKVHEAVDLIASPTNLAIAGVAGTVGAKVTRPVDHDLGPLFAKFRQVTGKEIPADIATNSVEMQRAYDAAARTPGLASEVQKARGRLVDGLREMIRDMGRGAGAAEGQTGKARQAVDRLRGSGRSPGQATQARRAAESVALANEGGRVLNRGERLALLESVRGSIKGRSAVDPRGPAMSGVLKDFTGLVRDKRVTVRDLEAIRSRLGKIAFAINPTDPLDPRLSSRARFEAARMYDSISSALDRSAPQYSKALQAGEKLRRIEEALGDVQESNLDDAVLSSFWRGKKPLEKFDALQQYATPEDVGAVKGWLFARLVERSSNTDGTVNANRLRRALSQEGPLNRQVVDKVLPGVSDDLSRMAEIGERARRGVLRPEGSDTASRILRATNWVGNAGLVETILSNPFGAAKYALLASGTKWVARRGFQSLLNGSFGDTLSKLAQGQMVGTPSRLPAAAIQQGGASGLGLAAAQGAGGVGQNVAGLMQLLQRGQQPAQQENGQ